MRYELAYKRLLLFVLLLLACTTVMAAQLAEFSSLPWAQFVGWVGMALLGGLVYTVRRLDQERKAGTLAPPILPGVIADLLASLLAGAITTALGAISELTAWQLIIPLFLAGYSGTIVLERFAATAIDQLAIRLSAILGVKNL